MIGLNALDVSYELHEIMKKYHPDNCRYDNSLKNARDILITSYFIDKNTFDDYDDVNKQLLWVLFKDYEKYKNISDISENTGIVLADLIKLYYVLDDDQKVYIDAAIKMILDFYLRKEGRCKCMLMD